jgi:RNA polymerase sigma-70 factor (ECF subfamily)
LGGAETISKSKMHLEFSIERTQPDRNRRASKLYVKHSRFVRRLAKRFGVNGATAEDVCQQVFLVAVQRLDDIEPGSEQAFLYGTALRISRRALRTDQRVVLESDMDSCIADSDTPEELVARRRTLHILDRALTKMEAPLRSVFIWSDLEGLSAPEISHLSGLPGGTVASRLRRARLALRTAV